MLIGNPLNIEDESLYMCFVLNTCSDKLIRNGVTLLLDDNMFMQDDEINLQCQLVEKLKQQMLDQDEVSASQTQIHTHTKYPN